MEARVKFCKTITEMFESGEIHENKIVFSDEDDFLLNGSSINKIISFGVRKILKFPYQNLFIQKK